MLMNRGSNVYCWLGTDSPAMSRVRLHLPQERTFAGRCPLFGEIRPLHPQQQTFLVVSPKVRSCRVGPGNFTPSPSQNRT